MKDWLKLGFNVVIVVVMLHSCPTMRQHQEAVLEQVMEYAKTHVSAEDQMGMAMALAFAEAVCGKGTAQTLMTQAVKFDQFVDLKLCPVGFMDGIISVGAFGKVIVFPYGKKS